MLNALNLLSGYTESSNGYETTMMYSASGEKVSKEVSNGRTHCRMNRLNTIHRLSNGSRSVWMHYANQPMHYYMG